MNELRTIYIIGNHEAPDKREAFFQTERMLAACGYKPLNPVRIQQEYEVRFGEMSQNQWRTKLLGHLLRADGVSITSGLTDTDSPQALTELKVATFCGKTIVTLLSQSG